MWKDTFKHVAALAAAAVTTLVVFSAVVSIADEDKAALLAARIVPALTAAVDQTQR